MKLKKFVEYILLRKTARKKKLRRLRNRRKYKRLFGKTKRKIIYIRKLNKFVSKKVKLNKFLRNKRIKVVSKKVKLNKSTAKKKSIKINYKKNFIDRIIKFRKRKNIKKHQSIYPFFKDDTFYFMRKLFNSFIKKGKKYRVVKYFLKVFFYARLKISSKVRSKKNKFTFLYFSKILNNIVPISIFTNFLFRGVNRTLPWIRKNKKTNKLRLIKLAVSWVKKSIVKRKEKTLFFKILSELEDIRKNKGESVKNKTDYYLEFCTNKQYAKFLKKREWL